MTPRARVVALVAVLGLLAGCSSASRPLVIGYDSLKSIHDLYLGTAASMKVLCDSHTINKATCDGWGGDGGFMDEFATGYTYAGAAWTLAASGVDGGTYDLGPLLGGLGAYTQVIAGAIADGGTR